MDPSQDGRRLTVVKSKSPPHVVRGNKLLLRYGLVLSVPAILALSVLSASPASAATRTSRPSAPRDVTATASDNTAIVRFVAPSSNGGSRVTGYYVEEYGRNSAIRRCDSTRCTVSGLSNEVHYRFAVAAINRFGRSAYSAPSNVASPTAPVGTASTITFDANGGSGDIASETEPYDTSVTLTLNSFTYTGYSFNDWNSEANGSGTNFTNGELVKFSGSATLYAQWTVGSATSTVVFNANGGSGTMTSEIESVATALTLNTFTRTGYTFSGWNTTASGSGTSYANGAPYPFTASVTLYARWTATSPTGPFTGTASSNWSGYVLPTSAPVTLVSGEWTVPTLNCANTPNGNTGTWVGTGGDGANSGALLQTGVNEECVNGAQENFGFWEIYPATPNHSESYSDFPVNAGDTMIATTGYVSNQWVTLLEDVNTGLSGVFVAGGEWEVVTTSSGTVVGGVQGNASGYAYSGGYSAEWIQEDVTNATTGSLFPIPDYGSVTFTELKILPSGNSLPNSDAWEIQNSSGAVLSVPGPYSGSEFTITYTGP